MINLHINPRETISWELFTATKPPYSVALDGYVNDCTKRQVLPFPYANFDHHTNVDRIATRSTAEQVYMEINLGLFETFNKDGFPHMEIYVNDCDEDTILATWLLINHERLKVSNPIINKLIYCNDKLDVTGGAFPFGDVAILRKMAWIFEPYRDARSNKRLSTMNSKTMRIIIESVMSRISETVMGNAKELPIDTQYEILHKGTGWSLVKESGTAARMIMYSSGIHAFVSLIEDGRYVIARRSTWTHFPVEQLYEHLNSLEGHTTWGGSNIIGGCLRGKGSKFSPKELFEIIELFLKKWK